MNAVELFFDDLQKRRARAALGLCVEYATFASAVFLATALYSTRAPMAAFDKRTGLRVRERFVDLIARVSPG
jgi:hypothetical protein